MDTNNTRIPIGKLQRGSNASFVAGCPVKDLNAPALGALVKVKQEDGSETFGLIQSITISDDRLVRQLVSGLHTPAEYIADNRYNRNLPVEISVLTLGFRMNGVIYHRLPPRPPLSLDALWLVENDELVAFTNHGKFGYLRHILRVEDQPVEELLVAHLSQAKTAHEAAGDFEWYTRACQELITLLRDDYARLANVLNALAELE